jgi:hypothetical protein
MSLRIRRIRFVVWLKALWGNLLHEDDSVDKNGTIILVPIDPSAPSCEIAVQALATCRLAEKPTRRQVLSEAPMSAYEDSSCEGSYSNIDWGNFRI